MKRTRLSREVNNVVVAIIREKRFGRAVDRICRRFARERYTDEKARQLFIKCLLLSIENNRRYPAARLIARYGVPESEEAFKEYRRRLICEIYRKIRPLL